MILDPRHGIPREGYTKEVGRAIGEVFGRLYELEIREHKRP